MSRSAYVSHFSVVFITLRQSSKPTDSRHKNHEEFFRFSTEYKLWWYYVGFFVSLHFFLSLVFFTMCHFGVWFGYAHCLCEVHGIERSSFFSSVFCSRGISVDLTTTFRQNDSFSLLLIRLFRQWVQFLFGYIFLFPPIVVVVVVVSSKAPTKCYQKTSLQPKRFQQSQCIKCTRAKVQWRHVLSCINKMYLTADIISF